MSLVSNERVLNNKEITRVINGVQRRIIKYASIGVVGGTISKVIIVNSHLVDNFILKEIPIFLAKSDFILLRYIAVPNWFSVVITLSLIVVSLAEAKIARNKMSGKNKQQSR